MVRGGDSRILVVLICFIVIFSNLAYAVDTTETTDTTATAAGVDNDKTPGTALDSTTTIDTDKASTTTDTAEKVSDNSYDWLENKTTDNVGTVFDDSLAIIALLSSGGNKDISPLLDRLKERRDKTLGCWPKGSCKVKDTAIAGLTMYLTSQDDEAEAAANWLKAARIAGVKGGEWWLVLKGSAPEGSCIVTYEGKAKTFNFLEDKIKEVGGKYYINLAQINPSILRALLPKVSVDCSNLPGSIVTLLHKPNQNTFFIQKSETAANVDLKVANTCFGETKTGSACDHDSSLYATWALIEMGEFGASLEDIGDTIYLQSKVKLTDVKQLAVLNRILYKSSNVAPSFVKELAAKQKQGGDWEGDVFTSSLAIFGLMGNTDQGDVVNRGVAYLERRKSPKDGSWDNNVKSTSMALITLNGLDLNKGNIIDAIPGTSGESSTGKVEDCSNGIDDDGDELPDCGDSDCEQDKVSLCNNGVNDECEEDVDCGGFCSPCEEGAGTGTEETGAGCKLDSECDRGQSCVGGSCVDETEEEPRCVNNSDCKSGEVCSGGSCVAKSGGSLWWLWLLIILIVLGGGGFLFYTKYVKPGKIDLKHLFSKKPKGQTFEQFRAQQEFRRPVVAQKPIARPNVRPGGMRSQVSATGKTKEDLELERSMREAERVLKGK